MLEQCFSTIYIVSTNGISDVHISFHSCPRSTSRFAGFFFLWYSVIMQKVDFESKKAAIAEIAKKHDLNLVVLFGSQATGRVHPKSDIDIAVLGPQDVDRFALASELDGIFQRDDAEVVVLNDATPTMMYVVARDGNVLYEDIAGRFASWKLFAMREWRDTDWLRALRDRKLVEWAKAA